MRALIIVATAGEAQGISDLGLPVVIGGIGPVSAALSTYEAALSLFPDLLICAGIGGAYPNSGLLEGDLAISSEMIFAGLGAQDGEHFLELPSVQTRFAAWSGAQNWANELNVVYGPMLTLETVTGSAQRATGLETRFPGVLTEGMEGAGVAQVGARLGIPVVELRGVSNMVGPRKRETWRIDQAMQAYQQALKQLF